MKIILAPDSYKESLRATAAVEAMARGVRAAFARAQLDRCPIADGGEGTVDALYAAMGGEMKQSVVTGPLGDPVRAKWALVDGGNVAVIELAEASGLHLVSSDRRDPTRTTTFGTGELIRHAMDAGAKRIILGIGGSATCDGGCGAAQALGATFQGDINPGKPLTGGDLARLTAINPALPRVMINVACDVNNPLTGQDGAAAVYGPQKGATPEQVDQLDRGLAHLRDLLKTDEMPGAGAAGGVGYGSVAMLGATLRRGVELVLDAVDFERRAANCDLCITGEGRLDGQSLSGKALLGVARAAAVNDTPTVALVGSIGPGAEHTIKHGLAAYHVISEGVPHTEALARAAELLEAATERCVKNWFEATGHMKKY